MEATDGSAGSTRVAGAEGDTGLDCAADKSAGDAASSSLLRASWEGKGEDIAPMGSEGSTGASWTQQG